MSMPKGGRGLKAPYETCVMRIPVDLQPYVEEFVEEYRELKLNGIDPVDLDKKFGSTKCQLGYGEARVKVEEILKQKKSAKESIKKLLQVLYPDCDIEL